jgi:hypothetical protein
MLEFTSFSYVYCPSGGVGGCRLAMWAGYSRPRPNAAQTHCKSTANKIDKTPALAVFLCAIDSGHFCIGSVDLTLKQNNFASLHPNRG